MRQKLPQNFPFTDYFVLNINFIYALELLKYFQKKISLRGESLFSFPIWSKVTIMVIRDIKE